VKLGKSSGGICTVIAPWESTARSKMKTNGCESIRKGIPVVLVVVLVLKESGSGYGTEYHQPETKQGNVTPDLKAS